MNELADTTGNGNVSKRTLLDVLNNRESARGKEQPSMDRLDSPVTALRIIKHHKLDLIVAGDDDGAVRIWNAE